MEKWLLLGILILILSFSFSGCEDILIKDENASINIKQARRKLYDKQGDSAFRFSRKISTNRGLF